MTEPWEPSNGTEAEMMWSYCERCEKDRASWPTEEGGQDKPEDGCPIIAIFGMNGRHPAWVIGDDGYPRCTEFEMEKDEVDEEGNIVFENDTETLRLFEMPPEIAAIVKG